MNTPRHFPRHAWLAITLLVLFFVTSCRPQRERSEHVTLRLTTQEIEPGSGFELVFEQPVIAAADVGTGTLNPLAIQPHLPGTFVWQSRRSGLFRPSEPPRLGQRYEFSLRSGLQNFRGEPVTAQLWRQFQTPGLRLTLRKHDWWNDADAPAVPVIIASANTLVDAADLARRATFRAGNERIAARVDVIQPPDPTRTGSDPGNESRGPRRTEPTWEERFPGRTNSVAREPASSTRGAGFVLRPARPLESTNSWSLEIAPGLRSAAAGVQLDDPVILPIGYSAPFELLRVDAANYVNGGRRVRLEFSRPVAPEIVTTNLAAWFHCEPPVPELTLERSSGGHVLNLRGRFELEQEYQLQVAAGLPAAEPLVLRQTSSHPVRFQPIRSTVWLPAFETIQLATGGRRLDLLAINTPETRLRLKLLDAHSLIPTLRAYERYLRSSGPSGPDTVPGAPLDYAGIPGRTVLDTNLVTSGPTDAAVRIERSWNELAPTGAYFIETDLHQVTHSRGGGAGNAYDDSTGTRIGPQALVQLTDLGLALKTSRDHTTVWVFSHDTAEALPGVSVSLRSEENEILSQAVTDSNGLVRLTNSASARWVLAARGPDLHARRLGQDEISTWGFDLPGTWQEQPDLQLFTFSDREAYRPGETVHLKVIARTWRAGRWQFPTNRTVQATLSGPRGDRVLQTNLVLTAHGSTEWQWTSANATRGTYRLQLECGDGRRDHALEVRDFQPAAFEITVAAQSDYGPATPLEIPVRARYLFGQPLSRARVLWNIRATDQPFDQPPWKNFQFGDRLNDGRLRPRDEAPGEVTRHDTAVLTGSQPLMIAPELPFNPLRPQPQRVELRVEVTDLNQQTLARTVEFLRHPSDFYLGFRWTQGEETLLTTNRPLAFQVAAVRTDGSPWPDPVDVQARLRRVDWKTVLVQQAGKVVGRRSEPEYHELGERTFPAQPCARIGAHWRVTADQASAGEFPAPTIPGDYVLELRSRDRQQRAVLTQIQFAIAGDGHLAWHQRNGTQVELVPDRMTYAPGQAATLLLKAPFPGTAWVTVEREDVRRSFLADVRGNAPALSIPLTAGDGPNVFVSAVLVRGIQGNPHAFPMPEWRIGYQSLTLETPEDLLTVNVQAGEPFRAPGEPVTLRTSVRNARHEAVPDAEVTLYAVDEGFLSLTGTGVPDPVNAFAAPRRLDVRTALSLAQLLPEDPELRRFENKGYLAGGGGRSLEPRRNFIPCPYWNASLKTDARGDVAVSFPAPDSLTRYRIVAVATHGAGAFGAGTGTFEVRKLLMIEPAMPRFAHVGDRLRARALVHNQTDHALTVEASLSPGTNALVSAGTSGTQRLDVAAGGTAVVEFPVELTAPGNDPWEWRVVAGDLTDASTSPFPVTRAEALLREVRAVRCRSGTTNLLADADPAVLELPETISVRLAGHPLALAGEGIEQLLHYPYGCVEQTGSSLLPWLALRDLAGLLPEDRRDPTNFAGALDAGVQRFWSMQTPGGGLAYWPGGSSPQRWGSAYAAWILALARDAGIQVASNRLARLHQWLDTEWRTEAPPRSASALHEGCLTALAFATAGRAEASLHESLLRDQDRLTTEDRALLALALAKSGLNRAAAEEPLSQPNPPPDRDRSGPFGNGARRTALQLLARIALAPKDSPRDSRTESLVTELLQAQRGGHWETTQGNAWALWALTEHARRTVTGGEATGTLQFAGGSRTFTLNAGRMVTTEVFAPTASNVTPGLILQPAGNGELYAEVTITGRRRTGTNSPAALDRGLAVQRHYARLDDNNQAQPATDLAIGDRVLVTLDIFAPEPASWVAIEDPLPALLEPIQGVFQTEATAGVPSPPPWSSDFREVRFDRTFVFRNELPEGHHQIQYLARVRAAGEAVAAPAKIEAMYEPQRHGFSAGTRLSARPAH